MPRNCRITSYQKLKKRNRELMHDIKMMVLHGDTEEGIDIYMKWVNKLDNHKE